MKDFNVPGWDNGSYNSVGKMFICLASALGPNNIQRVNSIDSVVGKDQNLVAMRIKNARRPDYHFIMKEDGQWVHKPGSEPFESGIDPNTVWDRNNYNSEIVYFAIKKDLEF